MRAISRRSLLRLCATLAGSAGVARTRAASILGPGPGTVDSLARCARTLSAYVDTLLPEEGASPSASALGVPEKMLRVAPRRSRAQARLLQAGCAWLDAAARGAGAQGFAALDEARRVAIVSAAQKARRNSVPAQFFAMTSYYAMSLYYTQPGAWGALAFPGPPQPVGFPDHDRPPRGRTA
jgi:hypothetical protein